MRLTAAEYTFHFPDGFDDRAVAEMSDKGYLSGGAVELGGRGAFPVTFFTPTRVRQELALAAESGAAVLAEPGLVVIPEVTAEAISRAIAELLRERFFDHLTPLPVPVADRAAG